MGAQQSTQVTLSNAKSIDEDSVNIDNKSLVNEVTDDFDDGKKCQLGRNVLCRFTFNGSHPIDLS